MRLGLLARLVPVGGLALLAGANCLGSDSPRQPDRSPPQLQVFSPVDTSYDLDGDKLVDVSVQWTDSGSAVDYARAHLYSIEGVNGPAASGTDLLTVWRLERLDATGLLVHETRANLLHPGLNHLIISVPDLLGNTLTDTLAFTLPYGAFAKTIPSGLTMGAQPADGITICADDNRLYMAAGVNLVVADPDSLKVTTVVPDPGAPDALATPLCVSDDPVLYVTLLVERFNRTTHQWLAEVDSSYQSLGIAQSRLNPDLLYVGETTDGVIGVVSRSQHKRVGQLLSFAPVTEYIHSIVVLDGDSKLYATEATQGGVLVVDPVKDSVLKRIPVGGSAYASQGDSGDTQSLTRTADGRHIYAAVDLGLPTGIVDIDTQADSVVRTLSLYNYYCINLALSPDQSRAFVSTQDNGSPSENVLVDISGWRVLQTFPRPRSAGATRFDRGVVFSTDGKLVFVSHDVDIDVYLTRE